jgi:hypothetical protein
MYTGTLIEQLIATVESLERKQQREGAQAKRATQPARAAQSGRREHAIA